MSDATQLRTGYEPDDALDETPQEKRRRLRGKAGRPLSFELPEERGMDLDVVTEPLLVKRPCKGGGPEGCPREHRALGFCAGHWLRFTRGQPTDTPLRSKAKVRRMCTHPGCTRLWMAKQKCNVHYNRERAGKVLDKPIRIRRKPGTLVHWGKHKWTPEVVEALRQAHALTPSLGREVFLEVLVRSALESRGYLRALERRGLAR